MSINSKSALKLLKTLTKFTTKAQLFDQKMQLERQKCEGSQFFIKKQ
jgi:hypothetical protein